MESGKSFQFPENLILVCEEKSHVTGERYVSLKQIMDPWWVSPNALMHLYSDMPDVVSTESTKQMKKILVAKLQTSGR